MTQQSHVWCRLLARRIWCVVCLHLLLYCPILTFLAQAASNMACERCFAPWCFTYLFSLTVVRIRTQRPKIPMEIKLMVSTKVVLFCSKESTFSMKESDVPISSYLIILDVLDEKKIHQLLIGAWKRQVPCKQPRSLEDSFLRPL